MSDLNTRHADALEMLRQKGLKRFAQIWTTDEKSVGEAIRLHHRTHDVNPDLKLYQSYLESRSVKMGGPVYIPTDYIADYDPGNDRVTLSVKMRTVQHEGWDRAPDFIAHHTSEIEELA